MALSIAVWTAWVDGGGVFSPTLSNQLIEAMAEVLNLTGAQHTPHSHQLRIAPPHHSFGMATGPAAWPVGGASFWGAVVLVRQSFRQPRGGLVTCQGPQRDTSLSLPGSVVKGDGAIESTGFEVS